MKSDIVKRYKVILWKDIKWYYENMKSDIVKI